MQLAGPVLEVWSANVADPLVAGEGEEPLAHCLSGRTLLAQRSLLQLTVVVITQAWLYFRGTCNTNAAHSIQHTYTQTHIRADEGLEVLRALASCPRCLPQLAEHAVPVLTRVSLSLPSHLYALFPAGPGSLPAFATPRLQGQQSPTYIRNQRSPRSLSPPAPSRPCWWKPPSIC